MTRGLRAFFRRSFFAVILSAAKDLAREGARHATIAHCSISHSATKPLPNRDEVPHPDLILGAGVTPAEGSVKPTAGFTFNQVIST
jgi:hypothetical protein